MKVIELYRQIRGQLELAGFDEADAEARLIVADGTGLTLEELFIKAGMETDYNPTEILKKRLTGMPLAYAMQKKYFMGFPFYVDSNVLIPRQETEIIADEALQLIGQNGYQTVLDLCCGSGCIGISMEKAAGVHVLGLDVSREAVAIANKNAELLGAADYRAVVSDLFANCTGPFDMIVCNPPYITDTEYETLEKQVRDFEPKIALVGNLSFYRKIAAQAGAYLNAGGALAFEIGSAQANEVEAILQNNEYKNIRCRKDLAGRDRVVICTIN